MACAPWPIVVFDIETDRLLNARRDNWAELRITVCVAVDANGSRHDFVFSRGDRSDHGDGDLQAQAPSGGDEDAATIARLGVLLDGAEALVAYNGRAFDLRVLANYYDASRVRRWGRRLLDPFEAVRDASGGRWIKLDDLLACNPDATDGMRKSADGVAAVRWWHEGDAARVLEYCHHDVACLRALALARAIRYPDHPNGTGTGSGVVDWAAYVNEYLCWRVSKRARMKE